MSEHIHHVTDDNFEAEVLQASAQQALVQLGTGARLRCAVDAGAARVGDKVTLGVRPEHLDITPTGWELQVEAVELLGAERLVYCLLGDERVIIRTDEHEPAPVAGATIHARSVSSLSDGKT